MFAERANAELPPNALASAPLDSQGVILPTWFEDDRVHAHTRFNPRLGDPQWWDNGVGQYNFDNAAAGMADLGAKVYTRHVKSTDEDPWWESNAPIPGMFDGNRTNVATCVPKDQDGDGVNEVCPAGTKSVSVPDNTDLPAEFNADADAHGVTMINYYKQEFDRTMAQQMPQAICYKLDGVTPNKPYGGGGYGTLMDITNPDYSQVVQARLLELAGKGNPGFYFDSQQDPPGDCRNATADAAFTAETGLQPPTSSNYTAPNYLEWMAFRTKQRVATFEAWRDAVKAVYPDTVFIVSVTNLASLTTVEASSTDYARGADVIKSEYTHAIRPGGNKSVFLNNPSLAQPEPDLAMSLGFSLLRDAAGQAPPHIWTFNLPNEDHVLGEVGSLIAHGAVANLDVIEANLYNYVATDFTPRDALKAGFALGNAVSPSLAGKRPVRFAAVHFSEAQRNARYAAASTQNAGLVSAWEQVLWPLNGAYQVFSRAGVPTGVVTDSQLTATGLEGFRLLFLPNRSELSTAQADAVNDWESGGGVVIEDDPAWDWGDPAQTTNILADLEGDVAPYLNEAPVQVAGGPDHKYSTALMAPGGPANGLAVAITNDFRWVQTEAPDPNVTPNPPAPAAQGVTVDIAADGLCGGAGATTCYQPSRVYDAVTNQDLPFKYTATGYQVAVPSFDHLAVVVVETEPAMAVAKGWSDHDTTPSSGPIGHWGYTSSVALDTNNRSIGAEVAQPTTVTEVKLVDNNASTRVTQSDYTIWASSDNINFTQVTGWSFSSQTVQGQVHHVFSGLSSNARYLKINSSFADPNYTFVASNPQVELILRGT